MTISQLCNSRHILSLIHHRKNRAPMRPRTGARGRVSPLCETIHLIICNVVTDSNFSCLVMYCHRSTLWNASFSYFGTIHTPFTSKQLRGWLCTANSREIEFRTRERHCGLPRGFGCPTDLLEKPSNLLLLGRSSYVIGNARQLTTTAGNACPCPGPKT